MGRRAELAKNTAILTVGKICTQCISFFLLPLYTAILSTEEYGTFDLLVTYSTLLLPLVNWQLDQGSFRFMPGFTRKQEERKKLIFNVTLFKYYTIFYLLYNFCFVDAVFKNKKCIFFVKLCYITSIYSTLFTICERIRRER